MSFFLFPLHFLLTTFLMNFTFALYIFLSFLYFQLIWPYTTFIFPKNFLLNLKNFHSNYQITISSSYGLIAFQQQLFLLLNFFFHIYYCFFFYLGASIIGFTLAISLAGHSIKYFN